MVATTTSSRHPDSIHRWALGAGLLAALIVSSGPLQGQEEDPDDILLPTPEQICPIAPREDPGPRLEAHIFQPSCDQPLLSGKKAVIRVWAIWPDDKEAEEDVSDIEVLVTIRDGGGNVIVDGGRHTFHRPVLNAPTYEAGTGDPWDPELMREGGHTFNLPFTPVRETLQPPLTVEIKPADPDEDLPFPDNASVPFEFVTGGERVLRIAYGFPFVGTNETPARAGTEWLKRADEAEDFVLQNFPIHAIRRAGAYTITPEDLGEYSRVRCGTSMCGYFGTYLKQRADERLVEEFTHLAKGAVVVVIVPHEVLGTGYKGKTFVFDGKSIADHGGGYVELHTDPSVALTNVGDFWTEPVIVLPDDAAPWTLAHELGHYFNGLGHFEAATAGVIRTDPDAADKRVSSGRALGIQGWRTPLWGPAVGYNKHSMEGNGEAATLEALMEPGTSRRSSVLDRTPIRFVADGVYAMLESNVPDVYKGVWVTEGPTAPAEGFDFLPPWRLADDGPHAGPAFFRELAPRRSPRPPVPQLLVTGALALDGSAARIDPLRRVTSDPPAGDTASGPFTLELLDGTGRRLASRAFDPGRARWSDEDGDPGPNAVVDFQQALPFVEGAASVVLRGPAGDVLGSVEASGHAPKVEDVEADYDDGAGTARISWKATDPDGDTLRFDVLYRPDREATWARVASAVRSSPVELPAEGWPRGGRTEVRVEALDGFYGAGAEAEIDVSTLSVWSTDPADGAVADVASVTATLSSDLDPGSASGETFTLADGSGREVAATVGADARAGRIWLAPDQPLEAGAPYRATLRRSVRDTHGRSLRKDVTWTFTTAADRVSPRVVRVSPRDGDITVAHDVSVTVEVSEPLDPSTVGPTAVALVGPGGETVAGSVSYEPGTVVIVFQPSAPLARTTSYQIRLAPGISDEAGNPIRAGTPATFTTAANIVPGGS